MHHKLSNSARLWLAVRLLAVSILAAVLASCGTSGNVRIELAPTAVVLNVGGTAAITVNLTAASVPGPFVLDASGLPSGVSASFSGSSLGAAGDSRQLTLTASPTASEGTFTVTVSATGAQATGTATLEVSLELLDVSGVVLDQVGMPLAGASVLIEGHLVTTTSLGGSFSISGVVVPYTVTVFSAIGNWAQVYEGLSTDSPVLQPLVTATAPATLPSASVQGTLTPAVPAGERVVICAEGASVAVFGCTTVYDGESTYNLGVNWAEGISVSLRLRAVRYVLDVDFNPTALTASGAVADFSISEGGSEVRNITLGTPPVASVNFTLNVETPFFTPVNFYTNPVTVLPSTQSMTSPGTRTSSGSGISLVAPFYSGSTFALIAQAQTASDQFGLAYRPGLTSGGTYTLSVPALPAAVAPADAATGVDLDTVFSISGTPGRVNFFLFTAGPTAFGVLTTSTSARIPDLAAHGLPLAAAETGSWVALNSPDFTDIDAEVSGEVGLISGYLGLVLISNSSGVELAQEWVGGTSGARGFTTAP